MARPLQRRPPMTWRAVRVGCCAFVFGCASGAPAREPAFAETRLAPASVAPPSAADRATVLAVSDDIRKACGMSELEAHFAYDSARLSGRDASVVDQLATCLRQGPLAGRHVRLVGHADSRGDGEYNLALGGNRADAIQKALTERRVAVSQLSTTSRGALDARGVDESGWQLDRRVDVLLAD